MSKERRGCIVERDGKLYVRITYTDQLGKRRELMRRANDKKHAKQLRKQLVKQLESTGTSGDHRIEIGSEKVTFRTVADRYEAVRLIPAQYVGDRKVAGLRSLKSPKTYLKRLLEHFGNARLRSITHSQVDEYRLKRLDEDMTIASVNRELALLRSIFNFAKRDGLIARTPFEMGDSLISLADETKRTRVLSRDEEKNLLPAFSGNRAHLRSLVIAALDTGCRRGELLKLKWRDVDLVSGCITIRAFNTKTAKSRTVPITSRLRDELQQIRTGFQVGGDQIVFNAAGLRRGWDAACLLASITELRFHDLRATFATRLISAGMPVEQVAKITGHTQLSTLYAHYIRNTTSAIERAARLLDSING